MHIKNAILVKKRMWVGPLALVAAVSMVACAPIGDLSQEALNAGELLELQGLGSGPSTGQQANGHQGPRPLESQSKQGQTGATGHRGQAGQSGAGASLPVVEVEGSGLSADSPGTLNDNATASVTPSAGTSSQGTGSSLEQVISSQLGNTQAVGDQVASQPSLDVGVQAEGEDDRFNGVEASNNQWINQFGLKVFLKERETKAGNENILISPFSLVTAFSLASLGASGDTQKEYQSVLTSGESLESAALGIRELNYESFRGADHKMRFSQANGIWLKNGLSLQPGFQSAANGIFGAEAENVDFSQAETTPYLNKWFSDRTEGMIPQVFDHIDSRTDVVLGNALYMKGRWKSQFKEEDTREREFKVSLDKVVQVPMMTQELSTGYFQGEGYESVLLPFEDEAFALALVLPQEGSSVTDLLESRNEDPVAELFDLQAMESGTQKIRIILPRLDLQLGGDFTGVIQALGLLNSSFYGKMTSAPVVINQVIHKTALKLDEEGAEAAAVTAMAGVRSLGPIIPSVVFDRPFLLAIVYKPTNTLLFVGEVVNPSASK